MEHGIQFYMNVKDTQFPRVFQRDYLINKYKDAYGKGYPFYMVGQYIHYANKYYDTDRLKNIKNNCGKTLFVFPFHMYELSQIKSVDNDFISYIFDEAAKEYDTVLVCAYWSDLESDLYKKLKKWC